jgi:hypothetical protein
MNPSDYRRDFAAYSSTLERERYNYHVGLTDRPNFEPIRDRYADLWTREAIDDLRRALDETPTAYETERTGLRALIAAARLSYLEARARDVTEELALCAGAARVSWDGEELYGDAPSDLIAGEADASRRRELAARWFDGLGPCDDLRAARLQSFRESARELGFESLRELYEDFTGVRLETLAASANAFLEHTAPLYLSCLAQWAARQRPPLASGALHYADGLRFERAPHLDDLLRTVSIRAAYEETMAGLGIRAGTQKNMQVDAAARPLKKRGADCFALRPPEEVRLVVGFTQASAPASRGFLHEAGRAQAFAWASAAQAARYPEFVYAPDRAANEGHAFLFSSLLYDAAWVGRHQGVRSTEAGEIARTHALLEMHATRHDCAALVYALALDDGPDPRAESLADRYVTLHTEATGFRYQAATRLLRADDALRAAELLRARLFAASMREHLRARHGRQWYASRAAGEELVDIWNTASRYEAGELSRLVGAAEPSFDLLAAELETAVCVEK